MSSQKKTHKLNIFGIYQTDECVTQEKFRCPKSLGASESLGAPEARTPFCLGQLGEGGEQQGGPRPLVPCHMRSLGTSSAPILEFQNETKRTQGDKQGTNPFEAIRCCLSSKWFHNQLRYGS